MATTRLSDVIVPEVFYPYMIKRTKERGAIFQSGILRSERKQIPISFLVTNG